jgi:hypothetical protein
MGFYKSSPPPPPQPWAKRKEQEPKFRDLLRKQNSNLLSPNQKPTKSTWKAPKTVAYFNTRGYEKVNDWVTTCVGPAKGGGAEENRTTWAPKSRQTTLPPSPTPPFLPYFPTYLPLSPPTADHMVLLLKLKAIKGYVAPPQDLVTRTGPFFPTLAHLVFNLGPFFQLWPT